MRANYIQSRIVITALSACGGALVLSCSDTKPLDSSKVDPKAIWGEYRADSDESSRETKVSVSLRFRSESGTPIRLSDPSRITLEQADLRFTADKKPDFKFEDPSYLMRLVPDRSVPENPAPTAQEELAVIWVQKDGTEFRNTLPLAQVPRLSTAGVPVAVSKRSGLQVRFESVANPNSSQQSRTKLRCVLTSKAPAENTTPAPTATSTQSPQPAQPGATQPTPIPATRREQSVNAEWNGGCFFSANDLADFVIGQAELRVIGERSGGPLIGHPAGGKVIATMTGAGLGFQINE
jgi:hypothetical protein